MNRPLSLAAVAVLIGLAGCNGAVLGPGAEPLSTGDQARTGGSGGGGGGGVHPDDPPLVVAPAETRVQGVVTEVPSRLGTAAFLIEENPDRPFGGSSSPLVDGEKYHVRLTNGTVIRRRGADGQMSSATLADIKVGTRAEVWFVGPILESYPAQGTAGRIMIFDVVP
jgi:hypothetical protein